MRMETAKGERLVVTAVRVLGMMWRWREVMMAVRRTEGLCGRVGSVEVMVRAV